MKNIFTIILGLFTLTAAAQLKNNTFYVVDSQTGKSIPSVSIAIVRAGLSITTEDDGIFMIPGDVEKMIDTIVISTQNYNTIRMTLASLGWRDTIKMQKQSITDVQDKLSVKNDTLLNDYDRYDVGNYVGLHIGNGEFNYLQIAQKFNADRAGTLLKNVTIERLAFYFDKFKPMQDRGPLRNGQYEYAELEFTKFKVRVYDVDPATGGPGKDLCNKVIEVKNTEDKKLATNLRQYNIIIPNKTFFVAVEWMRDYYNAGFIQIRSDNGPAKGVTHYRPAIGLLPTKGDKLNIWALGLNNKWGLYTYHSPDFTDLAIKATVGY